MDFNNYLITKYKDIIFLETCRKSETFRGKIKENNYWQKKHIKYSNHAETFGSKILRSGTQNKHAIKENEIKLKKQKDWNFTKTANADENKK